MNFNTRILYPTIAAVFVFLAASQTAAQPLPPGVTTLVSTGACWRLSDQGFDLGTNWIYSGWDDCTWSLGFAKLGYGDGNETTVVSFGSDANNKYITTYFRGNFVVPAPEAFTNLLLRLNRNDGAAVYLNGVEVMRDNLPSGPLNYLVLAPVVMDNDTSYLTADISPTLLLPGRNTLAVEIHQVAGNGLDIGFDLGLFGQYETNNPPLSVVSASASRLVLAWPASTSSSFILQSNALLGSTNWTPVGGASVVVGGVRYMTNVIASSPRFYRLRSPLAEVQPCQQPIAISQPLQVSSDSGSNITLNVGVAGTPTISYQWFHNYLPVAGANATSLTISNAQRADGGVYELWMTNSCDYGFSAPITVTVGGTNVTLTDDFASRPVFTDESGEVNSSNSLATAEVGEPAHANHAALRSVWMSYVAPEDGVVTFTTLGSAFDTLFAAYHGSSVGALDPIDADDDQGPGYTSMIKFAVTNGEQVEVAVDSYPERAGMIQLNWNIVATTNVVPLILSQPQSQTVSVGTNFTLSVTATNPGSLVPLTYQWRKNGTNLIGATASSLTVSNAQASNAGNYYVLVSNSAFTRQSQTASVAISAGTGMTIVVTAGNKRKQCSTYYYVGTYANPDPATLPTSYFQIAQPLQLLTFTSQGGSVINYPAWAYRDENLKSICTATRTKIAPTTDSGTYHYRFEVLLPGPGTFYVDYGPY